MEDITAKAAKRLYFLRQLKRADVATDAWPFEIVLYIALYKMKHIPKYVILKTQYKSQNKKKL